MINKEFQKFWNFIYWAGKFKSKIDSTWNKFLLNFSLKNSIRKKVNLTLNSTKKFPKFPHNFHFPSKFQSFFHEFY